jgi:ABC-2 type transport system ATP-binding protein
VVAAVEVKRRIGYVAETQAIPTHLTVRSLIDLHRDLYPTWDVDLERKLLKKLSVRESSRIVELSKGEARKAILLCAIAHRPELLILDEPAGGLDPSARREFLEVSIELLNLDGTTILFSSHHMADVERIAGRVAVIEGGNMLFDDDLDRLESYCLAILPPQPAEQLDRLRHVEGFVRTRKRDTSHYAVFSSPPDEIAARLERDLGIVDARCSTASLEEIFIALVGAES